MPRRCAVPHCNTGCNVDNAKVSFFRVPNDPVMHKKWEDAIPGVTKLERSQVICEKHFNDSDVAHEWIKRDSNGQVIARVRYKRARLNDLSVPSKFDHDVPEKENVHPFHEYSKSAGSSNILPLTLMKPSAQVISTLLQEFPETKNDAAVLLPMNVDPPAADSSPCEVPSSIDTDEPSSALNDAPLLSPMNPDCPEADPSAPQMPFEVLSPTGISERIWQDGVSDFIQSTVQLPESWSITELSIPKGKCILLSYAITNLENDVHCPLTERYVTLDADRSLNYFVYGHHIKQDVFKFDKFLNTIEMLPNILTKFRKATICNGLGDLEVHFMPIGSSYPDGMGRWRSKDCHLVCKKKRCDACAKTRKLALQRKARQQNRLTIKRIRDVSNPVDRAKLIAMRMRNSRERRQKLRAKGRVDQLMSSLKDQAAQIAHMKEQ